MSNDLRYQKNHQRNIDRRRIMEKAFSEHVAEGPRIVNNEVIFPSPTFSRRRRDYLRSLNFQPRKVGNKTYWYRPIDVPLRGKVYTTSQWQRWAEKRYTEWYPQWRSEPSNLDESLIDALRQINNCRGGEHVNDVQPEIAKALLELGYIGHNKAMYRYYITYHGLQVLGLSN